MQNHKILSKKNLNHNVIQIEIESLGLEFPISSFVYIYDDNNNCRPYTPIKISEKYTRDNKNNNKSDNKSDNKNNNKSDNYSDNKSDNKSDNYSDNKSDNKIYCSNNQDLNKNYSKNNNFSDDVKNFEKTKTSKFGNTITFAIKIYPNGKLSQYINKKLPGDYLTLGPVINKIKFNDNWKHVLMIAGGTGITPMLQIIENQNNSKFVVIFCNLTKDDVFLNDWLVRDNVEFIHVIEKNDNNKDSKDFNSDKDIKNDKDKNDSIYNFDKEDKISSNQINVNYYGRISKEIILKVIDERKSFDKIFVCGPDGMMNAVCGNKNLDKSQGELKGFLKEIGYTEEDVYKF
ncbi:NADH-cytochrome b5 reductase-like protein [Dictyocoela muelleri]|nr:NADH-cytochrome b5 reductase-like protein [Dictyocoela muelleri]